MSTHFPLAWALSAAHVASIPQNLHRNAKGTAVNFQVHNVKLARGMTVADHA